MSYYDFDYFWTHEEVGGKKSEVIRKSKKFDLIKAILNFVSFANDSKIKEISQQSENNNSE